MSLKVYVNMEESNKKLLIARLAFRDIKRAIDEWEISSGFDISACWDGYIVVDGELFQESQLREEK